MAKMKMEHALAKLTLGPKNGPNKLLNEFDSIECRYLLELSELQEKAHILKLGGAQYMSIIEIMIHCKKNARLPLERLLKVMRIQWHLTGRKSKDDKDSNNKDEIALAAMNGK